MSLMFAFFYRELLLSIVSFFSSSTFLFNDALDKDL